jgi:hypothetical protein
MTTTPKTPSTPGANPRPVADRMFPSAVPSAPAPVAKPISPLEQHTNLLMLLNYAKG